MLTQLSVLLLYKRIFTFHLKWFRNALGVIAFLSLTSNLSTVIAIIFQCSPIKKGWNHKEVAGHCVNAIRLYAAQSALALVVDLAIVVVPIPLIWTLHTNRRTKMAVSGIIMLGSLSVLAYRGRSMDRLLTDYQSLHCQPDQDILFRRSSDWGHNMLIFPISLKWPFLTTFQQMTAK